MSISQGSCLPRVLHLPRMHSSHSGLNGSDRVLWWLRLWPVSMVRLFQFCNWYLSRLQITSGMKLGRLWWSEGELGGTNEIESKSQGDATCLWLCLPWPYTYIKSGSLPSPIWLGLSISWHLWRLLSVQVFLSSGGPRPSTLLNALPIHAPCHGQDGRVDFLPQSLNLSSQRQSRRTHRCLCWPCSKKNES